MNMVCFLIQKTLFVRVSALISESARQNKSQVMDLQELLDKWLLYIHYNTIIPIILIVLQLLINKVRESCSCNAIPVPNKCCYSELILSVEIVQNFAQTYFFSEYFQRTWIFIFNTMKINRAAYLNGEKCAL